MDGEGPKWRLEHALNNKATCQQASCKRSQVKILTGELRIGTHTLFSTETEQRWYMAWRHWGCATRQQIKGLKGSTEGDATKAPGYDRLSAESQEQVRLAFEQGIPADKEFKDIREDLAKNAARYGQEYRNADGYKVDVATRAAACRGSDCLQKNAKIVKGELRLGINIPYDGEHGSYVYKHWQCMSRYDLEAATEHYEQESLEGLNEISDEYKQVVIETFKSGEVVEPPELEVPATKVKKPRMKKQKVADDDDDEEAAVPKTKKSRTTKKPEDEDEEAEAPKPKRARKKRAVEEVDTSEEEYVPKKSKSRQAPVVEEVDPAVAKIHALAEQMRENAAK